MKALVLLGYRNTGKDSIANYLVKHYKGVYNAKFGLFNKYLTSKLLFVPMSKLENKDWREREWSDGITPLDLLNAFFVFSKDNETFQRQIDTFVFNNIPEHTGLVVFTDIRRQREFDKVVERFGKDNVKMHYIFRSDAPAQAGDEDISSVVLEAMLNAGVKVGKPLDGTLEENIETVVNGLALEPNLQKHTLYLFTKFNYPSTLLEYEPLLVVAARLVEFMREFDLHPSAFNKLFNTIVMGLNPDTVELAPIDADSRMVYNADQHQKFIPRLREIANLRYCVLSKDHPTTSAFNPEEIVIL